MHQAMQVARIAAQDIEAWLRALPQTVAVQNVEQEPSYQAQDIDVLWTTHKAHYRIEIKGDRWHHTGNFFFETHSNQEKGTLGCLLYTQADLLFYYFVTPRILYILQMPQLRAWFEQHYQRFEQRSTTTPVGLHYYTTVGRLVPILCVREELAEAVHVIQLKPRPARFL